MHRFLLALFLQFYTVHWGHNLHLKAVTCEDFITSRSVQALRPWHYLLQQ